MLEPVGTAPGLVVPSEGQSGPTIVVLPGPPRELQPMWSDALQTEALRRAVAGATSYAQRTMRLFGIPESEIAQTLRTAEQEGVALERLEVTTCLKRGEIEIVTRFEPAQRAVYDAFEALVRTHHADTLFSLDGSTVDQQVAALLRGGALREDRSGVDADATPGVPRSIATGGVVHRRASGRAPDRPAGRVRLRQGRDRRLRQRRQDRPAGRRGAS